MILARKPLLWLEKSAFARYCPEIGKEPENPRVGGSIPPLATSNCLDFHVFRAFSCRVAPTDLESACPWFDSSCRSPELNDNQSLGSDAFLARKFQLNT